MVSTCSMRHGATSTRRSNLTEIGRGYIDRLIYNADFVQEMMMDSRIELERWPTKVYRNRLVDRMSCLRLSLRELLSYGCARDTRHSGRGRFDEIQRVVRLSAFYQPRDYPVHLPTGWANPHLSSDLGPTVQRGLQRLCSMTSPPWLLGPKKATTNSLQRRACSGRRPHDAGMRACVVHEPA